MATNKGVSFSNMSALLVVGNDFLFSKYCVTLKSIKYVKQNKLRERILPLRRNTFDIACNCNDKNLKLIMFSDPEGDPDHQSLIRCQHVMKYFIEISGLLFLQTNNKRIRTNTLHKLCNLLSGVPNPTILRCKPWKKTAQRLPAESCWNYLCDLS